MNNRTALANSKRLGRLKEIRIVLDSYRRRGEADVHAKDVARMMGLLDYRPVMELGRERIEDLQVDGILVTYARGVFTLKRPDRGL